MNNAISLGSSSIYASSLDSFKLDDQWDASYQSLPAHVRTILQIPIIGPALTLNGSAVWAAISTGDAEQVMDEVCKGLSNQPYDVVQRQLAMHCYGAFSLAEAMKSSGVYSLSSDQYPTLQGYYGQFLTSNANWLDAFRGHSVDFFGTPVMPVAALGYWLFGGGADRYVHISSLKLNMLATDFSPIAALLNDASNGAGAYVLKNAPFSYNTFNKGVLDASAALTIGRVSGTVSGTLNIAADGGYSFSGSFMLNSDVYDADVSNRTVIQEALTTFLRSMGDTFGHNDYNIHFLDSQKLELSGNR